MAEQVVKVLVEGGKASAGPPIGSTLGPLGINISKVVEQINEKTKAFAGMNVPIKIIVNLETKEFEIQVGTPPTSQLIKKEAGIEKGAGDQKTKVGDLKFKQVVKIAKLKLPQSLAKDLRGAVKEVLGVCVSMGVTIEGKNPKEVQREIDEGKWDESLG